MADLHRRLRATRWPEVQGRRSHDVPVFRLRGIVHHWLHHYDWRARESLLNSFGCFSTIVDDAVIDFLHVPSPRADAFPILLVHSWPGSVLEFRSVIRALTEPAAFGRPRIGSPFTSSSPACPGSGLSGAPAVTDLPRLANAWARLMGRLGYDRWLAHGGGWARGSPRSWRCCGRTGLEAVHLATYEDSDSGWAAPPARTRTPGTSPSRTRRRASPHRCWRPTHRGLTQT